MSPVEPPRVAIVGGTGAVGRTLLELMAARGFEHSSLRVIASERTAGSHVRALRRNVLVEDLRTADFADVDIAFFSAGTSVSAAHARRAAQAGALVIDNTNAFRMDPDSLLVVPQVNGSVLARRPVSGVIANPNCSTIPLVRLLSPIQKAFGLRSVYVSTYQAASGGGQQGIDELYEGARRILDGSPAPAARFSQPLAFDVLPAIDTMQEDDFTLEERKMRQESRRILALPELDLVATCVRVPVANGHSETVVLECEHPMEAEKLGALLDAQEEVKVWREGWPTPRTIVSEPDLVHVGRIRIDPERPTRALLWLVADNLRIGAALNALQIAERAVKEGIA